MTFFIKSAATRLSYKIGPNEGPWIKISHSKLNTYVLSEKLQKIKIPKGMVILAAEFSNGGTYLINI